MLAVGWLAAGGLAVACSSGRRGVEGGYTRPADEAREGRVNCRFLRCLKPCMATASKHEPLCTSAKAFRRPEASRSLPNELELE